MNPSDIYRKLRCQARWDFKRDLAMSSEILSNLSWVYSDEFMTSHEMLTLTWVVMFTTPSCFRKISKICGQYGKTWSSRLWRILLCTSVFSYVSTSDVSDAISQPEVHLPCDLVTQILQYTCTRTLSRRLYLLKNKKGIDILKSCYKVSFLHTWYMTLIVYRTILLDWNQLFNVDCLLHNLNKMINP